MGKDLHGTPPLPVEGRAKTVHAVERALDVLELIAAEGRLGVSETADRLDVHRSTVARLVTSLQQRGFVEESANRGQYQLGFAVVRLAEATVAQSALVESAQPECDRLAEHLGETVNLAVLDRSSIVNVLECRGDRRVAVRTWVGKESPAHATATGKVLFCEMSPTYVEQRIGSAYEEFTARTIVDIASLARELWKVRAGGWAATVEELEEGLTSVAVPVRSPVSKRIVAALCVSGPSYRLPEACFSEVVQALSDAALRIEQNQVA
ncbi:IclR family transcriptional regulator [Hoyosella sp. YIM 151337]|uniref:IclR family transcriptional regulator n=1 Tax=Hoyosella sp. YIM 151337 TaxID=2992742 RepID=UPI002236B374|nr:IclR family transcriptional regulator [Hoyosella sp. YIM 151337]MCW4355741.1 IclR family transcriptional regulator [Hoyosella sp. YIM 151337]